jgi:hypothetical protein
MEHHNRPSNLENCLVSLPIAPGAKCENLGNQEEPRCHFGVAR